jgi:hypothetical protein
VQFNALCTRVALLLFGLTCYLFLLVLSLAQLRDAPIRQRVPQLRLGCWGIGLVVSFGSLCIAVALLPWWDHQSATTIAEERGAPFILAIAALFFVGYVGWSALEIRRTIDWIRRGRPRPPPAPPAPPPPGTPRGSPLKDPNSRSPSWQRMALTHRMRKRLEAARRWREQ